MSVLGRVFNIPFLQKNGPRARCSMLPLADRDNFTAEDSPSIQAAKAVCRECPLQRECLEWAVESGEKGVWGGLTAKERKSARLVRMELQYLAVEECTLESEMERAA